MSKINEELKFLHFYVADFGSELTQPLLRYAHVKTIL